MFLLTFGTNGLNKAEPEYYGFSLSFTDIDTDRLLEKDSVTLDEALKTANNAVFLAVNAISTLLSVSKPSPWFNWLKHVMQSALSIVNIWVFTGHA